jgi:hypothetical protein
VDFHGDSGHVGTTHIDTHEDSGPYGAVRPAVQWLLDNYANHHDPAIRLAQEQVDSGWRRVVEPTGRNVPRPKPTPDRASPRTLQHDHRALRR